MSQSFPKNALKKRFKTFSVETFRKILKAWTITTNNTTDESVDNNCDQLDITLKNDTKTDETLTKTDETIKLDDSLDESLDTIPETPEFAEKRKLYERKNRNPNKSSVNQFFDLESEVVMDSKESFCDDIECTQIELSNSSQLSSLIDDIIPMDTQPVGQLINGIDSRDATDMKTVYLRSIKDQSIGNTEKYKLQYKYDPNIEVFSQEPNESDFEDYQFDGFCVPNDTIEMESPQPKGILTQLESPSPQKCRNKRKKFKRIIFSP